MHEDEVVCTLGGRQNLRYLFLLLETPTEGPRVRLFFIVSAGDNERTQGVFRGGDSTTPLDPKLLISLFFSLFFLTRVSDMLVIYENTPTPSMDNCEGKKHNR